MGNAEPVIELRQLTPDDWKDWRELRLAALADAPTAFGARLADWVDAEEERWRARLALPGTYNLIASLDGEPAGMASGMPSRDEQDVRELVSMWIAPFARGRGIGDRLMTAIETWAGSTGAKAVELSVVEGNEKAHGLYQRHGYVLTDKSGGPMPDGIHRELVLRKQL